MKLYVCGGCQRSPSPVRGTFTGQPENMGNTVERLDLGRQIDSITLPSAWEAIAPMPEQRSDATVTVLRGCLYVCGGQDGSTVLSSAARFDPGGMEWEVLPSMAEGAALNGCVYVCGGANTSNPLNSAERFNPALNLWEMLRPMLRHRSGAVSAVIDGSFCVAGGGDGQQPLSSAERLRDDHWEVLPSMSYRRIRAASAVIEERWFVCGGGDGRSVLNSAELLNLHGNWEGLQPMASPRWSSVAGVVAGCLYVCGGGDGESVLQSAERFDPMTGSWEELPEMSCARWDATAVVADCLYVLGGSDESEPLNSAERFNHTSQAGEPSNKDEISPTVSRSKNKELRRGLIQMAEALRLELQEAEAELELKTAELKACGWPEHCDDPAWLSEECQSLQAELLKLQEQASKRGPKSQESMQSMPFRVSRCAILEDELRQKSEVVRQLRQRELWFELQLRRQQEAHAEGLDSLRDEVFALRKCTLMRHIPQASNFPAPSQCLVATRPLDSGIDPSMAGRSQLQPGWKKDPLMQFTQHLRSELEAPEGTIDVIFLLKLYAWEVLPSMVQARCRGAAAILIG
eukprot:symbB.v1.2.032473.t1/scaffold3900.1/size66099/1